MNITREWFSWKIICKCGGNTSPRPFSKKSKLSIALDQQSKVLYSLFLLYVQVQGYRSLLKGAEHLLLPHIKLFFFFKKKKKGMELVLLPYFLHDFWKYFLRYALLTDQISQSDCLYYLRYGPICVLLLLVIQVVTSRLRLTF